jgi:hypothetical protein
VVAAAVDAGVVVGVVASVVGDNDVVGASIDVVDVLPAGEGDEPVDVSEHAAITPNSATAIAAARLTWRLRHRSMIEEC